MVSGVLYHVLLLPKSSSSSHSLLLLSLLLLFSLPLPTMFGRVYFGAHWIGDTIGGVLIGWFTSLVLTPTVFTLLEFILGGLLPSCLFH